MENNRKILIIRGAPGSGKTTFAKKLVKEQNYKRINRDDLRDMFNSYKFDKKDEQLISSFQMYILAVCMNEGLNIVIDNTHAKQKYINAIKDEVNLFNNLVDGIGDLKRYPRPEYKYDVEIKTMDTSLEECIRRNNLRDRVVPEEVIRTMYKNIHG